MGASQKVVNAQRNGDIGEFIDHLNGGGAGEKGHLWESR